MNNFFRSVAARAPITLRLCALLLPLLLAAAAIPGTVELLGLRPCDPSLPRRALGIFTHPFVMSGFGHWMTCAFWMVFTAQAIEGRFTRQHLFMLWAGAIASSGLAFLLVADSCLPFVGPIAIAWAYIGCAIVMIPKAWATCGLGEKLYFYLALAFVTGPLLSHWTEAAPPLAALCFGALFAHFTKPGALPERDPGREAP